MADVAARLRAAREAAGLSIEDVSARTRIKPAMLHAIELGHWDRLPGEFFARAFTRTYARELGLDEAAVLADYERAVAPPAEVPPQVTREGRHVPPPDVYDGSSSRTGWTSILVIAAAVAGIVLLNLNRSEQQVSPEPGAVGTAGRQTAPDVSAPATPAPKAEAQRPDGLVLELRPTRPVWVTGTADGERVLFRLVEPGERISLEAKEQMSFRVGDAGAFDFTLNGTPAKPVGRNGEVREFTVTRENLRSYLR